MAGLKTDEQRGSSMRVRAALLSLLMVVSSLTAVIAADVVTTGDVEISGNHTMTGNYTVSHGTTLTIKPGAVVDMADYWMRVEGTLIADDSTIMSSIQSSGAGSHNAGVWRDITVASGATATLNNVTISNAKSCMIIEGTLSATDLNIEDCLLGLELRGSAIINGLSGAAIDHDGVRISGTAAIANVDFSEMSGGIQSTGSLTLSNAQFSEVGTAIAIDAGDADIADITLLSGIANAIRLSSGVTGDLDSMTGPAVVAISGYEVDSFELSNLNMSGERLINSWSAGNITITDSSFTGTSAEVLVDVRTAGNLTLESVELDGAFSDSKGGSFDAPWNTIVLSGSGEFLLDRVELEAANTGITATGTGRISILNSQINSESTGLDLSGMASSLVENSFINVTSDGIRGINILQGLHTMNNLEVNMPYSQWESGSIGIEAWWSEITMEAVYINGFEHSIDLHDSLLGAENLELFDSSVGGLSLNSSMAQIDEFSTRINDVGAILSRASTLIVKNWTSSLHDSTIDIGAESSATVWGWQWSNNAEDDAIGSGDLLYTTIGNPSLNVGSATEMHENIVSFEDLVGNSIDVDWQVNGFEGASTGGSDTLPISETVSTVIATYGGIGVRSDLAGSVGATHTIQVPIMPLDDWIITSGIDVVLGPTPDGTPHMAAANITINNGASLHLADSILSLEDFASLNIVDGGEFSATNGSLEGEIIAAGEGAINPSDENTLSIDGDTTWDCVSGADAYGIEFLGDLDITSSCDLAIHSSKVIGAVSPSAFASLSVQNTLFITVLDKGEPVPGVSINIAGNIGSTDSEGKTSRDVTSRYTDASSTTWAGLMTVQMQNNGLTDYLAWDTNESKSHTFMVSTITAGAISDWLVLEKIWSPYYLSGDLTIPQGQTMTIHDGVQVKITDTTTISVEGILEAGSSTLSSVGGGARWGGLIIGDNAETSVSLLGTNLLEGSPLLTIDGQADVVLSAGRLSRSSGGEPLVRTSYSSSGTLSMIGTTLSDAASYCLEFQGGIEIDLQNLDTSSCNDGTIWAQAIDLNIDGFEASNIITLNQVSGHLNDVSASMMTVDNNDGLELSNLEISGTIAGENNRDISISSAIASNIILESSAGSFSGLEINCGGSGIGFNSSQGRASSGILISDSKIENCTQAVGLMSTGETAQIVFDSVILESLVALTSDGYDVSFTGGQINGSLAITAAIANLYDVEPTSYNVVSGEIWMWTSHVLDIRMESITTEANIEIEILGWSAQFQGSSVLVKIPFKHVDDAGETSSETAAIIAFTNTSPQLEITAEIGPGASYLIPINLISNQAPNIEIIIPDDGFRIMESLPIKISALIDDDLSTNDKLEIKWQVIQGQTVQMELSGETNNVTDLTAGLYVLKLIVTDEQGLTSTDTLSFEITLLDSDGDWILSCDSETWYDRDEVRKCGPNLYDEDDDNDGVIDSRDSYPTDACASLDSDNDGHPDTLHCPLGMTTWLFEDQDDDGDGIPDFSETTESVESPMNPMILVFAFVLLGAIAFVLMRKRRA
ncbi:MAG: hypothetical protein ACKVIR_06520 [Candidatus Poseidoniales archaeon]